MPKLTKRYLDSLRPTGKDHNVFDSELPGFGLRIKDTGTRSFFIQYRNAAGRTRKLTIGRYGVLTPSDARKIAREKLREVKQGLDPSRLKKQILRAPTVAQLANRYLEHHARPRKKASSVQADERLLRLYIVPGLGALKVSSLSREDVIGLHHSLRDKPYQANRVIALLSKMLNLAEKWGFRVDGSNPCRHVERFRERRRERFLGAEELGLLGDALAEAEGAATAHPSAILAIRLLLLTGARKGEVLGLKWNEVDFKRACLRLSDSKTGQKIIPLGAPALELLRGAHRAEGNPYVCFGIRPSAPLVGLQRIWLGIREAAGLQEVRLHDLRHSFASVGAARGESLLILGKILGHSQARTTERYSHLAADPVRLAADRISSEIDAALTNGQSG